MGKIVQVLERDEKTLELRSGGRNLRGDRPKTVMALESHNRTYLWMTARRRALRKH